MNADVLVLKGCGGGCSSQKGFRRQMGRWVFRWCMSYGRVPSAILEANGNLNCRCAKTTTAFIPLRKYESVEVRPVGSSCRRLEVL